MFQNLGVKLLCLLVAILLWVQAASTDFQEREVSLPLTVVGLPDSLAVARSRLPDAITVRLRENRLRLLLSEITRADLGTVQLDLSELPVGRTRVSLIPRYVQTEATPLSIIAPTSIDVRVQPRLSRAVAVTLRTEGEIPEGFAASGVREITPESVTVAGPKDVVEAIDQVLTDVVRLDRRRSSFRSTVDLIPPALDVELRPREAIVSIGIEEVVERVFDEVLVTVFLDGDATPDRLRLDPTTVRVSVKGAAGAVARLKPEDISVRVPIAADLRGFDDLPVEFVAIDGVIEATVTPSEIQVFVDAADSAATATDAEDGANDGEDS